VIQPACLSAGGRHCRVDASARPRGVSIERWEEPRFDPLQRLLVAGPVHSRRRLHGTPLAKCAGLTAGAPHNPILADVIRSASTIVRKTLTYTWYNFDMKTQQITFRW